MICALHILKDGKTYEEMSAPMNIEKVKLMYDKINVDNNLIAIVACVFWVIVLVAILAEFVKTKKTGAAIAVNALSIIIVMAIIITLTMNIVQSKDSITEPEWKVNYLKPYLQTKPVTKIELDHIEQVLNKPNHLTNSVFVQEKNAKNYFKLTFKNKKSIYISAKVRMSKTNDSYMTFKKINGDISEKYNQTTYFDPVIYVQKGYIPVHE